MMDTDLIYSYIEAHSDAEPEALVRLRRRVNLSLINPRMVSGHLQGRFLKMLMRMICPKRVLELGTYAGYSALCLAEGLSGDATVDTIEIDDELADFIAGSLASRAAGKRVNLITGDALQLESTLAPGYDVIFIDADKRRYPDYYLMAKRLLRPGGYIIADNTLWDGHVLESPPPGDRQSRGVIDFNEMVARDDDVEKVMLPLRDGLTIIRLKDEENEN